MAGAKEIRSKIASINNTQKITRAMEMVAASKMRKTQDRMRASRPYAEKIKTVIKHLARATSEYRHPFMDARDVKSIGLIVITSDRGLCGGLNVNLLREVMKWMQEAQQAGKSISLGVVGRKGVAFFKRIGGEVIAVKENLGDSPGVADLYGLSQVMVNAFIDSGIDSLYIAHNNFVNTMTQKPVIDQLLPLPKDEEEVKDASYQWDYIYEPEAKSLLDALLQRYIEVELYQGIVENIACEQAAKMMAMKSATDNAHELIKEFQLAYNKARQAAITQELAEIVGGADAL